MHDSPDTATGGHRPWFQEPMVWLVIAIPAVTIAWGAATVSVAFLKADTVVADEYRTEGLAIQFDPTRDLAATRLGVGALVRLEGGALTVRLSAGSAAPPPQLVVLLSHATLAQHDRLLTLPAKATGTYSAPLPALAPGHWHVEVSPADRAWRLTGEFVDTPGTLTLRSRPAA